MAAINARQVSSDFFKRPDVRRKKQCFTLAEIIVVVIVVAILVSLAIPNYIKGIERTKNKEAKTMLKLMASAEEVYRLENGFFVDCGNYSECNNLLDLRLSNKNWAYQATAPTTDSFSATATRQGSDGRVWSISSSDEDNPTCSGGQYCE